MSNTSTVTNNGVKMTIQDYGTSILIFIEGQTKEESYNKWLSLYNWNATSSEANYVTDTNIACWSTEERLMKYLYNLEIAKFENANPNLRLNGLIKKSALARAKEAFEQINRESYRSVKGNVAPFELGTITAEKPDEDFADSVLNYAFSQKALDAREVAV